MSLCLLVNDIIAKNITGSHWKAFLAFKDRCSESSIHSTAFCSCLSRHWFVYCRILYCTQTKHQIWGTAWSQLQPRWKDIPQHNLSFSPSQSLYLDWDKNGRSMLLHVFIFCGILIMKFGDYVWILVLFRKCLFVLQVVSLSERIHKNIIL
jgi:hypothetical protein